jgi:hypothetical protein
MYREIVHVGTVYLGILVAVVVLLVVLGKFAH